MDSKMSKAWSDLNLTPERAVEIASQNGIYCEQNENFVTFYRKKSKAPKSWALLYILAWETTGYNFKKSLIEDDVDIAVAVFDLAS